MCARASVLVIRGVIKREVENYVELQQPDAVCILKCSFINYTILCHAHCSCRAPDPSVPLHSTCWSNSGDNYYLFGTLRRNVLVRVHLAVHLSCFNNWYVTVTQLHLTVHPSIIAHWMKTVTMSRQTEYTSHVGAWIRSDWWLLLLRLLFWLDPTDNKHIRPRMFLSRRSSQTRFTDCGAYPFIMSTHLLTVRRSSKLMARKMPADNDSEGIDMYWDA